MSHTRKLQFLPLAVILVLAFTLQTARAQSVYGTIAGNVTGKLSNTATVAAPAGFTDTNPGNNSATATTPLTPQGDLSVSLATGPAAVPGTLVSYTLVVSNSGP